MLTRMLSLAVVVTLAWPTAAQAQSYVQVPGASSVNDITPDGSIVVGSGTGGGFYWRWRVDPAPTWIGGVGAKGVSDDGTVIVGTIIDPVLNDTVAGRWTAATGWKSLGYLPNALSCPGYSSAYDVSGDGSTVVGLSWEACNGRAFRWTAATGMQELQPLPNLRNRASAISGDGSIIGGFAQGNFSRTPAYWLPDSTGFTVDLNLQGEVHGFNEDGSTSVGTLYLNDPGGLYTAFVRDTATGNLTNLGALNPGQLAAAAYDISEDGNTIAGFDYLGLTREAWVWTAADGIVSVNDRLSALGVTGVPSLYTCVAMSDVGDVVVGSGAPGLASGYIADLSTDGETWVNIGGGAIGIHGIPLLAGTGSLVGGAPAGLELTNARESTLTVAWVSFNPTPVAALGGTIHTLPYNSQFLFNTDATGSINLNTTWPVGLPSGVQAWFQFVIADSSSIHGIVPSNALRVTTP